MNEIILRPGLKPEIQGQWTLGGILEAADVLRGAVLGIPVKGVTAPPPQAPTEQAGQALPGGTDGPTS